MKATTPAAGAAVTGVEHWTTKGDVRLFLWQKYVGRGSLPLALAT